MSQFTSALQHQQAPDAIGELLIQSQAYLGYFFDNFDAGKLRTVVEMLLSTPGTIVLTGVGKSGVIAKKIAMTMNSWGIKAFSLSPLNALHGDIGMVGPGDTVLLLSKSGESDELLSLCPALRNKGATLVAVVSSKESRLEKACDEAVYLPVAKELCPFDLAPTTSTVVQLLFGDLIAVALMRAKNIPLHEFSYNHPAGRIGKRLTLKVQDLMLKGQDLPLCAPGSILVDVLVELSNKKCGCILVVDEAKNLLGIFTDGDLRRALQAHGAAALSSPIQLLMTKSPRTISPDLLAVAALEQMEADQKHAITVLPVVEGTRLLGLIKMHDILQSGLK